LVAPREDEDEDAIDVTFVFATMEVVNANTRALSWFVMKTRRSRQQLPRNAMLYDTLLIIII
jgi:hypothetical protein